MMKRFEEDIWKDQRNFNKEFFSDMGLNLDNLTIEQKVEWSKEFFFHINKELVDLINCLPQWEMHYKNREIKFDLIESNLKEEYIDAFKYFMGLGQVLDISYKDLVKVYEEKTGVVRQKYEQNKRINDLRKHDILFFDIDGVLNNYPNYYLEWVYNKTGIKYKDMDDIKNKLDIKQYENIKEKYRLSGAKRKEPINKDAVYVLKKLHDKNEKIVLYTARPVSRYKRIYSDTLAWLIKNKVVFDAIYWTDFNKEDFYKLNFNIKYIVEDDIRNAMLFSHEGYKVYLINKAHNQNYNHKLIIRVNNIKEILNKEGIK